MFNIEYTVLHYYHSQISDECLCMGVLFNNKTTHQRDFVYISNFTRFKTFDDEADVDFVKAYLEGIKTDIQQNLFYDFNLYEYINFFANEFRFSTIKKLNCKESEDYVSLISSLYLRYDLPKQKRLPTQREKYLIKQLLLNNEIEYSNAVVFGDYEDKIPFDYNVDNMYIKAFNFHSEDLRKYIGVARQWAFAASELSENDKAIFIYESDSEDNKNLDIILKILNKNGIVLRKSEIVDYILENIR